MRNRLSLLLLLTVSSALSCGDTNELDRAIEEAMQEASLDDRPLEENISIRYYVETKVR